MYQRLVIVMVLATVMLAGVGAVGATDSQSWHLLGEDNSYARVAANDSTTHRIDVNMSKTKNATKTYKDVPSDETAWWYAEYPAQFDGVTFGEDNWIVNISHSSYDDFFIFADVCKVNESGEVTYLAQGNKIASGKYTIITCSDNATTSQTFNKDERLALRINHNRTTAARVYYYNAGTDKLSNLTSPSSDPGYPVPELSTIILFSIGLITLTGYVLLTRRRK
jgi:hypothetical protein